MASAATLTTTDAQPAPNAGKRRLIFVDAIRGAMLVLMAVNHIPSDVQRVTNHPFGFVSAAEGFVFMSGLMSGWVYSKRYYRDGPAAMKDAALRRALAVYLYHIVSFVAVLGTIAVLANVFGVYAIAASDPMLDHPWTMLATGVVFLQQPALFDILPMYCVFLVALPFVLTACAKGHRTNVLFGSFMLWLLANIFSPQQPIVHWPVDMGSFNLLAWQFIFVLGAVCGQAWTAGERIVPKVSAWTVTLALIPGVYFFLVRHAYVKPPVSGAWLDWMTNKNNVAPFRLLDSLIHYYLIYALVSKFPRWFSWSSLALLGRHSIFVFSAHIAVAYFILSSPDTLQATAAERWFSTFLMVGAMFAAAGFHSWIQELQKSRRESLRSPVQASARHAEG
ncbi:MAG TPA: OpgC domain-containing protein [Opitutaceae bacterium]